jgi:hypothetical protein
MLAQILSLMTNRDLVLAIWKVFAQQGFKHHPCLYCNYEKVNTIILMFQ